MPGDIRRRESATYTAKNRTASINTLVRTGARTFHGDHQARVPFLPGNEASLNVAEEHHSVGSPIFHCIRKYIGIHKRTPGLACTELAQFAVSVTQAECGLTRIYSGSK